MTDFQKSLPGKPVPLRVVALTKYVYIEDASMGANGAINGLSKAQVALAGQWWAP